MESFIERLIIMGLTVTLCFFIFAFRLVDIQVVNGKSYLENAMLAKLIFADPNCEVYSSDYKGDSAFSYLRGCTWTAP